jgi:hypothetical protein
MACFTLIKADGFVPIDGTVFYRMFPLSPKLARRDYHTKSLPPPEYSMTAAVLRANDKRNTLCLINREVMWRISTFC